MAEFPNMKRGLYLIACVDGNVLGELEELARTGRLNRRQVERVHGRPLELIRSDLA